MEKYRFIFYPSFSEKLFYTGRGREYEGEEIGANLNSEFREFDTELAIRVKVTRSRKIDERDDNIPSLN